MTTKPAITERVRDMYTRFPYPPPDAVAGTRPVSTVLDYARHVLWPWRKDLSGLRVLDAGCGTGTAAVVIARDFPEVEVLGIDLSETSLEHARELAKKFNVGDNLQLRSLPIERVGELNQQFDYIISSGVIHHLDSPDRGLRALTDVLSPSGGIFLMVYATYGRAGVYMLQDAMRVLGGERDFVERADMARTVIEHLPNQHPFDVAHWADIRWTGDAGVVDLLLHVRDRSYTVPQLYELLDGAGLRLARFTDPVAYDPTTYVRDPDLARRFEELDPPARAQVAELLNGRMRKHHVFATRASYVPFHPTVAGHVALALRPSRSPIFAWDEMEQIGEVGQEEIRLKERTFSESYARSFDLAPWNVAMLAECDGTRTAMDIFCLPEFYPLVPGDTAEDKLATFGELVQLLAAHEVILCEI
jgi:SAM-dependent methyltransferase